MEQVRSHSIPSHAGSRMTAAAAGVWAAVLLSLVTWSFWADFRDVAVAWQGPQYSHGLIVPVAAVLLIWYRRHTIAGGLLPRDWAEWWAVLVFLGLLLAAGLVYARSASPAVHQAEGHTAIAARYDASLAGTVAGLLYAAALIEGAAMAIWSGLRQAPHAAGGDQSDGEDPAPHGSNQASRSAASPHPGATIGGTGGQASSSRQDSASTGRQFVALEAETSPRSGTPWGSLLALGLIGLGLMLRLAFGYFGLDVPGMYAFVPIAIGVLWFLAGPSAWRRLLPAAVLLPFMFPLPFSVEQAALVPLQTLAAKSGTYALQTLGFEASNEGGNFIRLEDYRLGVVEQCSGLRMATVLTALVLVYVFLVRIPLWQSIVLVVAAVPIAVAVNFLRITITGVFYVYAGRELAEHVFHDWAGYLMPPVAILLVALLQWLLDQLFYVDLDPDVPLARRHTTASKTAAD